MTDALETAVVEIVERAGDIHWTVVLDEALKSGAVPPSADARGAVLAALSAAARAGQIRKTSTGTYAPRRD